MKSEPGIANIPQPAAADDAQLLDQVRMSDESAIANLYDRYSPLAYSVALRVLRDAPAAEDILQEIFMQIWRHPDTFSAPRGSLGGCLAIVARNRSIDMLRRRRSFTTIDEIALASPVKFGSETERDELLERARAAVRQLPREQRKSLEMAFFDGLTPADIGEVTHEPPGGVKTRIRSGLLTIRKAFQS